MKDHFKAYSKKFLAVLLCLALASGIVAAAVFTMYYANNTATVRTADVVLAAGPDAGGTTYPGANVTFGSTYDYATVSLSLFPSDTNTPQPFTYYTNLLQIKNNGASSHTITDITITSLSGATNLGNITIYYYTAQTDSPSTGTATGYASITSGSSAPVVVYTGTQSLAASGTHYIEIIGYADSGAEIDSTVGFIVSIKWS